MVLSAKHFPANVNTNHIICEAIIRIANSPSKRQTGQSAGHKRNHTKDAKFCTRCHTAWKPTADKRIKNGCKFLKGVASLGLPKETCPECNSPIT